MVVEVRNGVSLAMADVASRAVFRNSTEPGWWWCLSRLAVPLGGAGKYTHFKNEGERILVAMNHSTSCPLRPLSPFPLATTYYCYYYDYYYYYKLHTYTIPIPRCGRATSASELPASIHPIITTTTN